MRRLNLIGRVIAIPWNAELQAMTAIPRKIFSFVTTAALLLVVGCGIDAPVAPSARTITSASAISDLVGGAEGSQTAKLRHAELIARRDSIRIATRKERTALRAEFEAARQSSLISGLTSNTKLGETLNLLRCAPLEYAADAEVIGPKGGTLRIGPHTLVIPPGALTQEQLIVGHSPMGELVQVQFGPHGLRFLQSARLTLSYGHCLLPALFKPRVVYVDDALRILELPPSRNNTASKVVDGWIDHFSGYMIAY